MAGLTHDLDKYPMLNSLNADPRYLGCAASLVPMIQFTSSQRLNMASTNLIQALPIKGCEMPNVASGYERQFLDYTFNPTRMPQSGTSLYVIPKYRANAGSNPIKSTPSYTLIYLGEEDNKIHCIEVPTYMKGVDGFGYPTEINPRMLRPGIGLTKDDTIVHSHSVDGSKYMLGTNANVCYITMKETVEDAFCISDRFADKLESTGIKTVIVDIDKNDVPLNLYGDVDNYKFCPDIGEYVKEDGLIIALRSVNDNSIISDMNETALTIPQYQHDNTIYAAAPNAVIIDIDVWVNENRKVKTPEYIFNQCHKYVEGNKQYYKRIIDIYNSECVEKKYEPSVEFGTLVERAVMHLSAYNRGMTFGGMSKKTPPKFSRKNEPISFIQMAITYMFKYKVSDGYKITGILFPPIGLPVQTVMFV